MTRLRHAAHTTFRSLRIRNFRLYFVGQLVSVSGTWMQSAAQAWLVVELAPRSQVGVDLGIVVALQFLPMLVAGAWGGLLVDRLDKRTLLFGTQSAAGLLAFVLGVLDVTGVVRLWQVFLLALLLGFVNLVDNPARQTFVLEMVGRDLLQNAVSLNSILMNGARLIGPAFAAVFLLLGRHGPAICFFVNAGSFVAVIAALALMRSAELQRSQPVGRAKGQLRAGLAYAWRTPVLRDALLLVFAVGTLTYNFTVILPLLAKTTFHGDATNYSLLLASMAAGAVLGGLVVANRGKANLHVLCAIGIVFGALVLGLGLSPTYLAAVALIAPMGAASIAFISTANSTIQLRVDPTMRGRVMALYAIGFLGTAPIGGPLIGWIAQASNPRVSLFVGGATAVTASTLIWLRHRRDHRVTSRAAVAEPVLPALADETAAGQLGVA